MSSVWKQYPNGKAPRKLAGHLSAEDAVAGLRLQAMGYKARGFVVKADGLDVVVFKPGQPGKTPAVYCHLFVEHLSPPSSAYDALGRERVPQKGAQP